jgi:hypothetical protein
MTYAHQTGLGLCLVARVAQTQPPLFPAREFCSEPFTISVVQVSFPGSKFPLGFEFDQVGYRIFLSKNEKLAIQHVDPATGLLVGNFQVIDSGVVKFWGALEEPLVRNGPEWGYSTTGSELYYMKRSGQVGNDRTLYRAMETSPDVWSVGPLPEGTSKGFPSPSKDTADLVPKVLYSRRPTGVQDKFPYDIALRSAPEDPTSEQVIPAAVTLEQGYPRWVSGADQVVFSLLDANDVEQAALYHIDSGLVEQITFYAEQDGVSMDETWASPYPELGPDEKVVWFVVNGTELRVLREVAGSWIEVNRVNPSQVLGKPAYPYIVSPEPFSYGGKPYIAFQLSSNYHSVENGLADIYIMQPQATTSCHFRLISPDDTAARRKPEPLALQDKPVVYFLEGELGAFTLYQAETGL